MSSKKGIKFYQTLDLRNRQNDSDLIKVYKDWAKDYDNDNDTLLGTVSQPLAVEILSDYMKKRNSNIIDVGCGTGLVGKALNKEGFSNFDGIDISQEMLNIAKDQGYKKLIKASLNQKLPIKENAYEIAFCVGVFTHNHVKSDRLDELIRIVKQNGLICFTVNEEVYEVYGFHTKIEQLESEKKWKILSLQKLDYMIKKNVKGYYCLASVC